jgi:hypothetical protein
MHSGRWPGTWRVICDVCGFEFASNQVKQRWDNLIVCRKDYETKHPQLLIRVREESPGVPFARPEPEDQFVAFCTLGDQQAIAGQGSAGCMIAGYQLNLTGY